MEYTEKKNNKSWVRIVESPKAIIKLRDLRESVVKIFIRK